MQLVDILIKKNLINKAKLEIALKRSDEMGEHLGKVLIDLGLIKEEELCPILSKQFDIPYITLSAVDKSALTMLTPEIVHRYEVFPIRQEGKTAYIATSDPCNITMIDELRLLLGYEIKPLLAKRSEIVGAIKEHYGLGAETLHRMAKEMNTDVTEENIASDVNEIVEDASIIRLVNQILFDGCQSRATDIHLEPYEDEFRIRYRIDGVLYQIPVSQDVKKYQDAIISRIKVMSSLNIAEKRLPQDGRFKIRMGNNDINLRVSILPTPFGEGVQIRVLSTDVFQLPQLGMKEEDLTTLEEVIKKPHGIIFVTGPTGSGKTTSLYAFLQKLNTSVRKIITIEDPIEYQLKGVTQIQIHPYIGLTFAQGLRSMLRHDPDVMMVGEVRDTETAEIAIRVALTGHLVFSTIHTNDSAGAVTRLLDMGIEPYLIASSAECIVAQRLVRVICPHCKAEDNIPDELLSKYGKYLQFSGKMFVGRGCEKCKQTGYIGRTGIYEILVMNDAVRELVLKRKPANEIAKVAISQGMLTLRDQGFEKVRKGITTIAEVLKVTQESDSNA